MALFCAAATTGVSGGDRKVDLGGGREAARGRVTWDRRAGFGLTWGRCGGEVWFEKGRGLVFGRGQWGEAGTGILFG